VNESGAQSGPTALRIILGAHLRRMREAAAISRSDAGWEIRSSESKVSRMELGRVGFKERDVGDLLTFLSTPGAQGLTGQVIRACGGALIGA